MADQSVYVDYLNQECDAPAVHEDAVNALITAGALVAVADGCLDAAERDRALDYIEQRRLAPRTSREQIAERFEACARRLQSTDFAGFVLDALRPVPGLGLALDVVEIAEEVAEADGTVHPSEAKTIELLQLVTSALPEPKIVRSVQ